MACNSLDIAFTTVAGKNSNGPSNKVPQRIVAGGRGAMNGQ